MNGNHGFGINFNLKHNGKTHETQKFSILTSCALLGTNLFLPPHNEWDNITLKICNTYGIKIIGDKDYNNKVRTMNKKEPLLDNTENITWRSMDSIEFFPQHKYWLFHGWKYTPEKFYKIINK